MAGRLWIAASPPLFQAEKGACYGTLPPSHRSDWPQRLAILHRRLQYQPTMRLRNGDSDSQHMLTQCPNYDHQRLLTDVGTELVPKILADPKLAEKVAKWFIQEGVLDQFNTAYEMTKSTPQTIGDYL
jgi:hypothetical protein